LETEYRAARKGSPTADAFLIRSYGTYKPFIINMMGFVRYNPATALSAPVPHSREPGLRNKMQHK
jgi:hypothetical protein